jgi:SET domain-containing protein
LYLFNVTEDLVIDGKGRENTARYINHSCKPNAEAEHEENEDRIFIRAIKKIREGDEITYDYGKEYIEDMLKKKNCVCRRCVIKKK